MMDRSCDQVLKMTEPAIPLIKAKQLLPAIEVPVFGVNGLNSYPANEPFDDGVHAK